MKTTAAALAALSLLSSTVGFAAERVELSPERPTVPLTSAKREPRIQLALLLDNSGSMQGLLNQARSQLWAVVNRFAKARQQGVPGRLEIAIYEYGERPKMLLPFTQNLDKVSEVLFGIGIEGGDEYCGQVISEATRQLEWSGNADDLKLIYIAGNEPFTQGPVDYREAIASAKKKGIAVQPIHCGGADSSWGEGARVAGVKLLGIDHNVAIAAVTAPQDAELAKLSNSLNGTYLSYGTAGKVAKQRQSKMDEAAAGAAPAVAAERAVAKGSSAYSNSDWDLVDAKKNGKKASEMKEEALPEELRAMAPPARDAFVEQKAAERADLQKRIGELSKEREAYLAKQKVAGPDTLDDALVDSARTVGKDKAFTF